MSYNQLPAELKRLIVEHIHQADVSYRRRRVTEGRRVLRARSLASFSRVNEECRRLALPHLITTLRASKAKHRIFEERILNKPEMSYITVFRLDLEAQHANLPLIVLYILPHLPNLRCFVLPSDKFLQSISPHHQTEQELSAVAFTVSKLAEVARRITEWDVKLTNGLDYESILFAEPNAIRSLAVKSISDDDFRLLGSDAMTFSHQLARCSSLETLKLTFQNRGDTVPYKICHPDSLVRSYPFRETLTSLELSVTYGTAPAPSAYDHSLISFASSFPNLRHLRLDGVDYSSVPFSSFSFPQLVDLELLRMPNFSNLAKFLRGKSIPNIKRVEVGIMPDFDLDHDVSTTDTFQQVARALNRFKSTLEMLSIHHKGGITRLELQHFRTLVNCQVLTSWREAATEVGYAQDPDLHYEDEEMLHGMSMAIEDLSTWTVESMRKLREQGDAKGMSDLWKELNGVHEYRKWMAD